MVFGRGGACFIRSNVDNRILLVILAILVSLCSLESLDLAYYFDFLYCIRMKKILEQVSRTLIFYEIVKFHPFLPCYVDAEKRAGVSNSVQNLVLEACSNIFFPLG